MTDRLEESFFERPTPLVARELLGKILVHDDGNHLTSGIIVETEAYLGPGDPASHAHREATSRSGIMFGPAGRAYIYFTYGMHNLFNVVTEKQGAAGAVLIRALEPLEGKEIMIKRRGVKREMDIASGPAKLTQAMGIDLTHNGISLMEGGLFITEGPMTGLKIEEGPRIGISDGKEALLRFYILSNPYISKK